jgi:DNA-binding NtrC family response regulator
MRRQQPVGGSLTTVVTNVSEQVTILVISPLDDDHLALQAIIGNSNYSTWILFTARDLVSALALLQQHEIVVVVCEQDLQPGTWKDVLEKINGISKAPSLIVTSRLADWHLWAEALNLGAWDVLAKPFNLSEAIRSIQSASQHWHDQIHMLPTMKKLSAAS